MHHSVTNLLCYSHSCFFRPRPDLSSKDDPIWWMVSDFKCFHVFWLKPRQQCLNSTVAKKLYPSFAKKIIFGSVFIRPFKFYKIYKGGGMLYWTNFGNLADPRRTSTWCRHFRQTRCGRVLSFFSDNTMTPPLWCSRLKAPC